MLKRNKWLLVLIGVIIVFFLVWYFSNIFIYILVAAVLSIMGRPLVHLLDRIRVGKRKFPHTLSAIITLLVIYGVIFGFFALVVPMLVSQLTTFSTIDPNVLLAGIKEPVEWLENFLIRNQVIQPGENLEIIVSNKLMSFISITNVEDLANSFFSFASSFLVAVFVIGFITFFFLKEDKMLIRGIMILTPVKLQSEIKHIYLKIIRMLSKYFLGLCLDLTIVISLITICMSIFGFKNALMIGVFAGMMNIVPYVGPFIGWTIALIFATTGIIDSGGQLELLPVFLKISGSLIIINNLDAFIFQPLIYSNFVKAHPLEIFLVILIAGSAAGILGMVLAIPTYTVIRIIAKEFLIQYPVIKKITKNI